MTPKYDLHSHSTASDGALSPAELLARAKGQGVTSIALTDHDTTAGLAEAMEAAEDIGIELIPGIELSTTWNKRCLHIVGLGINPEAESLHDGIRNLQDIRAERAKTISMKLEKKGIAGAYEAVTQAAGEGMITRSHFADFLLSQNHVDSGQDAFDRYLGDGKPAFVATVWAELPEAVQWITEAGGIAVLAHPLRYRMTASWMRRLLAEFREMGGAGLEVVTGRSSDEDIRQSCLYAQKFDLAASTGSDFHSPDNQWVELGRLAPLPGCLQPVWELLD